MYKNSYINNFVKYEYKSLAAETSIIKQEVIKWRFADAGVHWKEKWNI